MSKVYEALKKAEREGRWSDEQQTSAPVEAVPSRATDGATALSRANISTGAGDSTETAADGQFELGRAPRISSVLKRTAPGSQASSSNGGPAQDIHALQSNKIGGAPASGKVGVQWRFWRRQSPSFMRAPRLIVSQESLSRAAEQFQVLRVNLESWAFERDQRVIMITSALPGEGKSFVALNLAVALSRAGAPVLLVDADLRAPSLHRSFNLVPLGGLLSYLEGKAEFNESITATPERGLRLLAAGGTTLAAPEALAGSRMRTLIDCARRLDPPHIILLDTAAAAAGPEAQIISKLVDGALLVVAANTTPRALVSKTMEPLKGLAAVSAVLNRFEYSYSARQINYYGQYKI